MVRKIGPSALLIWLFMIVAHGGSAQVPQHPSSSLVDYLKQLGQESSFEARKGLALRFGVVPNASSYLGSSTQNTDLLNKLKEEGAKGWIFTLGPRVPGPTELGLYNELEIIRLQGKSDIYLKPGVPVKFTLLRQRVQVDIDVTPGLRPKPPPTDR